MLSRPLPLPAIAAGGFDLPVEFGGLCWGFFFRMCILKCLLAVCPCEEDWEEQSDDLLERD